MSKESEPDEKWYAVVTRFRNEKATSRNLANNGLYAYVPLRKQIKQYRSKKKISLIPLLNCYVFVKLDLRDQVRVLETPGVLGFVKFSDQIAVIPDREMEVLEMIERGDYPSEVVTDAIREGDMVEVTMGVLRGLRGRLIKINNLKTFVVSIESIGHSISIYN